MIDRQTRRRSCLRDAVIIEGLCDSSPNRDWSDRLERSAKSGRELAQPHHRGRLVEVRGWASETD